MKAKNITKAEFEKRIADIKNNPNVWNFLGERPAIIDFYAPWCGPCKSMASVLDEIAAEYASRIDVYKVNVDEEEELAAMFGISSVPSFLFIPMSDKPQMALGALPKRTLIEAINNILLNK